MKFSKEKGITLIALIITIIVLLILAGVTLAMIVGDNGILTRTNEAKEKSKEAEAMEEIQLEVVALQAESEGKGISFTLDYLLEEDRLVTQLQKKDENATAEAGEGIVTGTYRGYTYIIDGKFKVSIGEKSIEEAIAPAPEEIFQTSSYNGKIAITGIKSTYKVLKEGSTTDYIIKDLEGNEITKLVFPSKIGETEVTAIWNDFLKNCNNITYIELPETITETKYSAIQGMTGLKEVKIKATNMTSMDFLKSPSLEKIWLTQSALNELKLGDSSRASLKEVKFIGTITEIINQNNYRSAFNGCANLSKITIPNTVTRIGNSVFSGCTALTSINMPTSLTTIEASAFSGCTALAGKLVLPEGLTTISSSAFKNCSSLTYVEIPSTVTSLDGGAFENCSSLSELYVKATNLSGSGIRFSGCHIEKATFATQSAFNAINIENNKNYLKEVVLLNGVTEIPASKFWDYPVLDTITLPNTLTTIGSTAFYKCVALKTINIPSSITSIADNAFNDCSGMTINIDRITDAISRKPWGASNSTVNWTGTK